MKATTFQIMLMIPPPYFVGSKTAEVLENLSCLTKNLYSWFLNNQIITNDDKCHLILSSLEEDAAMQIKESRIKCSKVKKLLGIHIDYKLKFDTHVDTILRKAHRKLTALSRITNYIELPKRCILMNASFKIQFNYCSIIWMFRSRSLNNKINRLHERCLGIVYNNKHSNFEKLLNKDNFVSLHDNNVHALATELYKKTSKIASKVFKLRVVVIVVVRVVLVVIYHVLRSFLQIQFIVFVTELNQIRIWDLRFGSKYLHKLKIRNIVMNLKKKSKNGNALNVSIEFVGHLYLI